MSKENIIITGKTVDEVVVSANTAIQRLTSRINQLEQKLANTKGVSDKVQNNVVRVVSNKGTTYIEAVTNDGKFKVNLTKEG